MERINDAMHHAEKCLYPDVEKLGDLSDKHELVIVSRGDPHFQSEKIKQSGILEHVDDYAVVHNRPKDQGIEIDALVDDSEFELEQVGLPDEKLFLFERPENSLEDVIEWVQNL